MAGLDRDLSPRSPSVVRMTYHQTISVTANFCAYEAFFGPHASTELGFIRANFAPELSTRPFFVPLYVWQNSDLLAHWRTKSHELIYDIRNTCNSPRYETMCLVLIENAKLTRTKYSQVIHSASKQTRTSKYPDPFYSDQNLCGVAGNKV